MTRACCRRSRICLCTCPLGDTPQDASHRIFAALRQLDRDGVEGAFCQTFDTAGIGLALMNRLDRAAGFAIERV